MYRSEKARVSRFFYADHIGVEATRWWTLSGSSPGRAFSVHAFVMPDFGWFESVDRLGPVGRGEEVEFGGKLGQARGMRVSSGFTLFVSCPPDISQLRVGGKGVCLGTSFAVSSTPVYLVTFLM